MGKENSLQRELTGYREALSEMADEARTGGSWRSSQKSIQKAIQRLFARLLGCQRRLEDRKRLTQTMTFEEPGGRPHLRGFYLSPFLRTPRGFRPTESHVACTGRTPVRHRVG